MNRLMGKKVLITAAGQGMGRAAAIAMANEGAKVFATDINTDALETLSAENKEIETFELDVMDPDAIAKAPKKTGPLTTLFNCAGFVHNGTILDMSDDDWDFSFTLNARKKRWVYYQYGICSLINKGRSKPLPLWLHKSCYSGTYTCCSC